LQASAYCVNIDYTTVLWGEGDYFGPVYLEDYTPSPLLDNIQVMVIVWRLRGNIIRTAPCWVV